MARNNKSVASVCVKAARNMFLISSCSSLHCSKHMSKLLAVVTQSFNARETDVITMSRVVLKHSLMLSIVLGQVPVLLFALQSGLIVWSSSGVSPLYTRVQSIFIYTDWICTDISKLARPVLGAHWCTHIKPSPPVWLDYKSRRLTISLKIVLWDGSCMVQSWRFRVDIATLFWRFCFILVLHLQHHQCIQYTSIDSFRRFAD